MQTFPECLPGSCSEAWHVLITLCSNLEGEHCFTEEEAEPPNTPTATELMSGTASQGWVTWPISAFNQVRKVLLATGQQGQIPRGVLFPDEVTHGQVAGGRSGPPHAGPREAIPLTCTVSS